MTTIGERNRPLQIQQSISTYDTEGTPQEDWTTIGRVFAAVQPLTAQESLIAAQAGVQITHLVTVGYRPDLAAPTAHDLRFVDGARVLEVVTQPIDLDSRHVELQIQCRELLPT